MIIIAAAAAVTSVMSDSLRPHRQQPTRLPRPWDSPGKNTGVGCHFLLQCMKVKSESEVAQSCPILCDPMDCSLPGSSIHGIFQARVLEWVPLPSPSLPLLIYKFMPRPGPAWKNRLGMRHTQVQVLAPPLSTQRGKSSTSRTLSFLLCKQGILSHKAVVRINWNHSGGEAGFQAI